MRIKTPKGSKREEQREARDGDQPKRDKLRRSNHQTRSFTDVLGPLAGYVRSVVGRPFAKVFSEISQVLRPSGLAGSHAQDHLWQMLIRKVVIDAEGFPCHPEGGTGWRHGKRLSPSRHYDIAYVDPRDGIIKLVKEPKPRPKPKPEVTRIVVNATKQCHKLNDIWYMVTVKPVTFRYERVPYYGYRDVNRKTVMGYHSEFISFVDKLLGVVTNHHQVTNFYGREVTAVSYKQMNKREIKKYVK